ncbi:MAG: aminomethyl transferase family protein [Planctomycetes bacterium]|nr:aminomethyl transferase family protein [Planctomycetota bacterium]
MRSTALAHELSRLGAVLDSSAPIPKVLHFGDAAAEARAAFAHGIVRDQSTRARIVVKGKERIEFVNRMCTNDITRVAPTVGVAAALTTAKGKLVDLVRIGARMDAHQVDELLLLGSDGQGPALKSWLEKYIVMEELVIEDVGERDASLLAFGPVAEAAVRTVLGSAPAAVEGGFGVSTTTFEGSPVLAFGGGAAPLHGIELIAPAAIAGSLFARLAEAGLAPIGEDAWNQVRIEAGIPLHGRELNENANPLEASLLAAVSFSKGCYIGQEVVARLNSYSKVQRLLVGARFPASVDPGSVHEIFWDLLRVGHATSAVHSPRLDATVALAFVKSEYAKPGTAVYTVKAGERIDGVLCEVPFR